MAQGCIERQALARKGRRRLPAGRALGFAVGALLTGVLADAFGFVKPSRAIADLTAGSGLLDAVRMDETHPRHGRQ